MSDKEKKLKLIQKLEEQDDTNYNKYIKGYFSLYRYL
jgi:hypothetical protein